MRTKLPQLLGKPPDAEISLADTQQVVAHTRGFGSWVELAKSVLRTGGRAQDAGTCRSIASTTSTIRSEVRHSLDDKEWDEIIAVMAEQRISGLDAGGQMTDAVLERVAGRRSRHAAQPRRHRSGSPTTACSTWHACRSCRSST